MIKTWDIENLTQYRMVQSLKGIPTLPMSYLSQVEQGFNSVYLNSLSYVGESGDLWLGRSVTKTYITGSLKRETTERLRNRHLQDD